MKLENLNKISGAIIDSAIEVHKELGPGLLETLYEEALCYELEKRDIAYEAQILTYLKITKKRLGLILNFNAPLMKNGIKRIIL